MPTAIEPQFSPERFRDLRQLRQLKPNQLAYLAGLTETQVYRLERGERPNLYAVTLARTAPARTPARLRVPTYAVWETVVFVLNVLAFMLIGMQLGPIWSHLDDTVRTEYCIFAGSVLCAIRPGTPMA